MINKIRHYFKRRQALRIFADKFLFEQQITIPVPQPTVNFMPDPNLLPGMAPQPSNTPPVMPQPLQTPEPMVIQRTMNVGLGDSPQEQIVKTLSPMANDASRAKMDIINRRVQ